MQYKLSGLIRLSFCLVLLYLTIIGCEREYLFRGDESGVSLSADTVKFDTIFTSMGSATKYFKIFNPSNQDMLIEAIQLGGGEKSDYRVNINGEPVDLLTDVRLRARDSLFVFVDVFINPTGDSAPFIVSDSVLIYTRERLQCVQLVAFGQDVVRLGKEKLYTQTFTSEKPYLVTECVEVAADETLTIMEGTKLHFAKDACMIVYGTLKVNGTVDEPVVFTGARREEWYKDKPGQWGYIQLMPGSGETRIDYAHIRNSKMGLVIDSVGLSNPNPVRITNSRIEHISGYGIVAQTSALEVGNTLISNCGKSLAALTVGGRYEFVHCTLANYYNWSFRTYPSLLISNFFPDKDSKPVIVNLEQAYFKNCIIYGRNENELMLDLRNNDDSALHDNIVFSNCLIKVHEAFVLTDTLRFKKIIRNKDPKFVKPLEYNFQLDTLSPAQNAANNSFSALYPFDILGKNRLEDKAADLGAYERLEKK